MEPLPPPRRRRRPEPAREPPRSLGRQILDALELSGPSGWWGLGLVLGVLVIGFGPLLLLALLDVSGPTRKALVALGPVSICLGFAILVGVCARRYGKALGWSRRQAWLLMAMFVGLGLLGGLGLWFGEA
ncbi:hypothetical protein OV208_11220 [Corallococcus sp. bb12-1]|uniref:hypothetical protein n=1 Tax=Corallococcus sp. bb12-1 TaxID=2996784 RepID=UPI00226F00FB|nr:hypothetical protein [Corallococcus sp. bb12-1]MCY1041884.1 hypothetical protein [Corallococcus sp. bb12-1]